MKTNQLSNFASKQSKMWNTPENIIFIRSTQLRNAAEILLSVPFTIDRK